MMFYNFKMALVQWSGLSRDALHIYIAMGLFLLVRLIWRGRFGTLAALLVVAGAALTGEWLDHRMEAAIWMPCDPQEHWRDLWNTLFWPAALAAVLPWLPRPSGKPAEESLSEDAESRLEQA